MSSSGIELHKRLAVCAFRAFAMPLIVAASVQAYCHQQLAIVYKCQVATYLRSVRDGATSGSPADGGGLDLLQTAPKSLDSPMVVGFSCGESAAHRYQTAALSDRDRFGRKRDPREDQPASSAFADADPAEPPHARPRASVQSRVVGHPQHQQVATIVAFYEIMSGNEVPTVADFQALFGQDNEGEVRILLREKFPNLRDDQVPDPVAVAYVNERINHPHDHPSRFLQCIKSQELALFTKKIVRQIQFPPESLLDLRRYKVTTGDGTTVVFEFSQNEPFIETIYLPSGRKLNCLIDACTATVSPSQ